MEMKLVAIRIPINDIAQAKYISKQSDLNFSQFIRKSIRKQIQSFQEKEHKKNNNGMIYNSIDFLD